MAYFKIGNTDFSMYVNELKVSRKAKYNSQTNAAGDTVVDFINNKWIVEVGIIPLDSAAMIALQTAISGLEVSISFRNPSNGALETIQCMLPEHNVEYYTIRADKVSYDAFKLKFTQL